MNFGGDGDIAFEVKGYAGIVTLTRPKALNALNNTMVLALMAALDDWESDPSVHHIVIKAEGRAFCAGGDLLELYRNAEAGNLKYGFFEDEYRLNARLGVYPKPVIALINGIVMGGGVGISVHGRYRVMTQNSVFAMPEVGIGFFPDVGGSFFLSRLPKNFGMFLALTGCRIRAGDALECGLATHLTDADALPDLEQALAAAPDADALLKKQPVPSSIASAALDHDEIDRLFCHDTLDAIIDALDGTRADSQLAAAACKAIGAASPTSLAVTFRQIKAGRDLSLADCLRMEYRILVRMLQGRELYEGIRAVIVDKTQDPHWQPETLAEVTPAALDAYFLPLGDDELTKVAEAQ